jgi:DNA-binding response OmpR family regulator
MHMCPNCGVDLNRFNGLTFGNLTISETSEIYLDGQLVQMTTTYRMIVEALVKAEGRPLSRDTLLAILGNEDHEDRTIDVYIRRIRQAFLMQLGYFDQIVVERHVGYRWRKRETPTMKLVAVA